MNKKSTVNLTEITNLIQVRNYIENSLNNFQLEKSSFNKLNKILILLNKKIVDKILSDDFYKYIDFENEDDIINEVIRNSNIKSSLKK